MSDINWTALQIEFNREVTLVMQGISGSSTASRDAIGDAEAARILSRITFVLDVWRHLPSEKRESLADSILLAAQMAKHQHEKGKSDGHH